MSSLTIKPKDHVYTTYEISRSLSVDITTVMAWIDQGKLIAYKTPGGHRRVLQQNLVTFLKKYNMPFPPELKASQPRILIVDDDPQILRILTRVIKKINPEFEIETAGDGFEAGRKMESFNPCLVVLDIMLPGIDGFRVCENIRKDKGKDQVGIIAISGKDTDSIRDRILSCGANEFFGKPLNWDAFSNEVLNMVKQLV